VWPGVRFLGFREPALPYLWSRTCWFGPP
jgi:hypothetical protein